MLNFDILHLEEYAAHARFAAAEPLLGDGPTPTPYVVPVAFKICNYSSAGVFALEFFYSCYLLYRLLFKNEHSKALIAAVVMIIYSSLTLAVFFIVADLKYFEDTEKLGTQIFYIFCN